MRLSGVPVLVAPLVGAAVTGRQAGSDLTVKTSSGTFTGFVNASVPNVNQWLGIPYGLPPVGSRRFMPPEKAPNAGAKNATSYQPICMQDSGNHTGTFWELVPEFQNVDAQSEDCLYLNVWGPRKPVEKKLPVIVWVCGGGFKEGGGHAPYQVPDEWIQRTQTHLVVAFKYERPSPGGVALAWSEGSVLIRISEQLSSQCFWLPRPFGGK